MKLQITFIPLCCLLLLLSFCGKNDYSQKMILAETEDVILSMPRSIKVKGDTLAFVNKNASVSFYNTEDGLYITKFRIDTAIYGSIYTTLSANTSGTLLPLNQKLMRNPMFLSSFSLISINANEDNWQVLGYVPKMTGFFRNDTMFKEIDKVLTVFILDDGLNVIDYFVDTGIIQINPWSDFKLVENNLFIGSRVKCSNERGFIYKVELQNNFMSIEDTIYNDDFIVDCINKNKDVGMTFLYCKNDTFLVSSNQDIITYQDSTFNFKRSISVAKKGLHSTINFYQGQKYFFNFLMQENGVLDFKRYPSIYFTHPFLINDNTYGYIEKTKENYILHRNTL
ncbi:MAG: hypothetical protein COA58_04925 [Bacteroidetes bacterium]|nr:MAG: hypothetical protein COA58_04925 [Bacteroidota bacterium]